jgi:serine/threonine-protein kinase
MGEVWRATDTKLGRDVAIKLLPEEFAKDAERIARFEREAKVLAALNHPNIASIYAIEECALVMELVEGETLKGALPAETALNYAKQIAEALEAAHEKGISHRDLKPANIMITPQGVVKVLDFGLAAVTQPSAGDPMTSTTLTISPTQAGMILGTAAYMSPEQARGKPVDKRADIWAFGVVLYEMLTGRRMYSGETVSDTLASVIKDAPDLASLPATTPYAIRYLLRRCLEKDPRRRLQAIGEARCTLEQPAEDPAPAVPPAVAVRRSSGLAIVVGVLGVVILTLGVLLWQATRPVLRPMMRFSADLGPDAVADALMTAAISRDGRRLVHPVRSAGGSIMLATRLLDQFKSTVSALRSSNPVVSGWSYPRRERD